MISRKDQSGDEAVSIAKQALEVYDAELKTRLESEHRNEFVAIEPISKAYFIGKTFLAAAMAAKHAFPSMKSFVLRIGHDAAFHIGASQS